MSKRVISQPLPVDVRDWSFSGLDCQGWDFSGRDIRGCNFRDAKLNGANFTNVIAGRSKKQQIRDILTINFNFYYAHESVNVSVNTGTFAFVCVCVDAVLTRSAIDAFAKGEVLAWVIFSLLALAAFIFMLYSFPEAINDFKRARGTDFSYAVLKSVDFTDAVLNNCWFYKAETNDVNWKNIIGRPSCLEFTNNQMQLLISRKGANGIYQNLDLKNQNLSDIDLMKANLSGTDFTNSNLQKTDLRFANLSNINAVGTDFSHAKLTGACIRNLIISSDTKFTGIECEYIYLTPDQTPDDRRPLSGIFEPGDFQLLIDKISRN